MEGMANACCSRSSGRAQGAQPSPLRTGRQRICLAAFAAVALWAAGCKRLEYVSLRPLDEAGFNYSSIQQIDQLRVSKAEVPQIVTAYKGGLAETTCVELVRIAHGHKAEFLEGDAATALHAAGIADDAILELARAQQIAPWGGEAQAIRLTGITDRIIVALARRRAAGQEVPSGASLAKMKDAGVAEPTMLELVNRGITEVDAGSVEWRKKHHWTDEQILKDFPPKT